MATIYNVSVSRKRIMTFAWSKDWYSFKPWLHKGENIPYITIKKNLSDSGKVSFTYIYIGPLAIVSGKWIA